VVTTTVLRLARAPGERWAAARPYHRGVVFVLVAAVSFGTLGTLSGLAYRAGMTPATFAATRYLVGALVLGLVLSRAGGFRWREVGRRQWLALGAATAVNAVTSLTLFAAFGEMAVALVLAVYFIYPVLVALLSVVVGRERLTPARVIGLPVALAGLALVLGAQMRSDVALSVSGVVLASVAALTQAVFLVIARAGWPDIPSRQATTVTLTGAGLICVLVAVAAGDGAILTSWWLIPGALVAVLVAGIVSSAWAKVLLLRGLRRIGGTRSAVLMLLEPVAGALLAAVFLAQPITLATAAGAALVLGAALLVQRPAPAPGLALPEAIERLR
jgi:drug/metabolite transporter, DME family